MESLFLLSAHRLMVVSTKFHKNILGGIKVLERTRFASERFQRSIIPYKNVGGVMALILCTPSDDG